MVTVVTWPAEVLRLTSSDPFIRHYTRSAGQSLVGVEQILAPGASRWEMEIEVGPDWDPARIKAFEVLVTLMEGKRNVASLPIHDAYAYDEVRAPAQQAFADGTWFTDGTGFVDGGSAQPLIVSEAASAGARSIRVSLTNPTRPRLVAGDLFSIDGYLYRVVSSTDAGDVGIRPDLRTDVAPGAVLATDPPIFHARFEDDGQGRRPRDLMNWATPVRLRFVEAFDRVP